MTALLDGARKHLGRKPFTSTSTAPGENSKSALGRFTCPETVPPLAHKHAGLISAFHAKLSVGSFAGNSFPKLGFSRPGLAMPVFYRQASE